MFYRYHYPEDVDVTVAYVAPLNFKVEDGRHEMGFTVMSLSDSGEIVFHHEFAMLRHFVLAALPVNLQSE